MYHFNSLTCLLITIWSLNAPLVRATDSFYASTHTPHAAGPPSANSIAAPENVIQLQQSTGSSPSARLTKALAQGNGASEVQGTYGTSTLKAVESGLVFTTPIQIGDEQFTVVIDTGSSDTWVVENNYACHEPQGACNLSTTYTRSSTYTPINNENFNISYADKEYLNGVFGTEKVTLAGITVNDAQIALVEEANWIGDGVSSGVVGLGFPAITRAFSGTSYSADSVSNLVTYNPLFTKMYVEGSVPQIFSLAFNRDGTGQFAIGGTPNIQYVPTFASSPFQLLTTSNGALGKTYYTYYTITTNGFEYQSAQSNWNTGAWLTYFGNPNDPTKVQVIIDSGYTVNLLPQTIADAVNNLFEPAAKYNSQIGYYTVACNAKAPEFGVKIGMETFYINPQDMIISLGASTCITGVSATGNGGNSVLGQVFLKNVLAIFDVGASEMRFAAREYY